MRLSVLLTCPVGLSVCLRGCQSVFCLSACLSVCLCACVTGLAEVPFGQSERVWSVRVGTGLVLSVCVRLLRSSLVWSGRCGLALLVCPRLDWSGLRRCGPVGTDVSNRGKSESRVPLCVRHPHAARGCLHCIDTEALVQAGGAICQRED